MFPDHDNPSTAAAAAPAQDSESEKAKNEEKPGNTGGMRKPLLPPKKRPAPKR